MNEPKWKPGDIVEFIPGNYLHEAYNMRYWMEGVGIIISNDDGFYKIMAYRLVRTSAKNLATYDIGDQIIKLPILETDRAECFRSLED